MGLFGSKLLAEEKYGKACLLTFSGNKKSFEKGYKLFVELDQDGFVEASLVLAMMSGNPSDKYSKLKLLISQTPNYADWIRIAKTNARLERYACLHRIQRDQSFIDDAFKGFVMDGYQKLAGIVSKEAPAILPKIMDRIATGEKVALVVADGMSMFDYEILSEYMQDFECTVGGSFAVIPTITSVSRQALLAGKYPQQLDNPFSLAKEESGFYAAAQERSYAKAQCFYGRGFDASPGSTVKIAAIIINDIDDIVVFDLTAAAMIAPSISRRQNDNE